MNKEQVNKLLKAKGIFCDSDNDEYIDTYRETYKDKMSRFDEEDFYYSMIDWFFDGNAPYYDIWLKMNWRN